MPRVLRRQVDALRFFVLRYRLSSMSSGSPINTWANTGKAVRKVTAVNPPVSRREEAGGARRAEGANHCARRHRARETLRGQFGQPSRDSGNPRNGIARDCSPAKAARTSATETAAVSAHDLAASASTALRHVLERAPSSSAASARPCDQILKSPPPIPQARMPNTGLASTCHCRVIGVGANRSLRRRMYKYGILCHY